MIHSISKERQKEVSILALVVFNYSLLLFRIIVTQSIFYGFLVWNLILAGVPYIVTYIIEANSKIVERKFLLFACSILWLLFLPNAPYIITDFLHFKTENSMPAWFDILLLTSFSWSGIAFGFLSMIKMQQIWENRFSLKTSWIFLFFSCLLSGFGIYLGRFVRYNSWDILTHPIALVTNIPLLAIQLRTIGFSLGYGLFFFLLFVFFKIHNKNN